MDHAVDTTVLEIVGRAQNNTGPVDPGHVATVAAWLTEFESDIARRWMLDAGFALWEHYATFGENNHGVLVLIAKLDQQCVRLEPVKPTVDGDVIVPEDFAHLDVVRKWLLAVALRGRPEVSIVNATHVDWHETQSPLQTHGIPVDQLLGPWLDAQVQSFLRDGSGDSQHHYYLPPMRLEGELAGAHRVGVGVNGRMAWEDDRRRYEFDRQHGTVEVYSLATGEWLCEMTVDGVVTKTIGGESRRWGK